MFNFTKEERQKISYYMAMALAEMEHSSDAQEVISNLYCAIMEDSSPKKGRRVAEITTQAISEYNEAVKNSQQDNLHSLNQFFEEKTKNMDSETKQAILDNLVCGIGCMKQENGEVKFIPQEKTDFTGNATVEDFYNTVVAVCENVDTDKILESIKMFDYSNFDYVKSIIGADMYAAINGVIVYCMAKKGELGNMPTNVSVTQCILGSYVELRLVDSIGNAYIVSKNDEWLKKEIAKSVLIILPAAIFIMCILAVLIAIEAIILPELTLTVSGVLTALVIAAPFIWYMAIIAQELLFPMVEALKDSIKEMRIFTEVLTEQESCVEFTEAAEEKTEEYEAEYYEQEYDSEEEIAEI